MVLRCDSSQYEVLENAAASIKGVRGMTCEVGVRAGGGSKFIIDGLMKAEDLGRTHVCIDPYGHIDYQENETSIRKIYYTNGMRNRCMIDLYEYVVGKDINLLFFCLEDTEFFRLFQEGVPIYKENKTIETKYALVHFDGPHSLASVMNEVHFFETRVDKGALFVFDDVIGYYPHSKVEEHLLQTGWERVMIEPPKASYVKVL